MVNMGIKSNHRLTRRRALQYLYAGASVTLLGHPLVSLAATARGPVIVWKTPNCGCCKEWVKHLNANGFESVTHNVNETASKRTALGLPERYGSCHTATLNGYVLEGHVPAQDIHRLLREKPLAIGLAVPGMPVGSPGMDMGTHSDAYEVLLVLKDGSAKTFHFYQAKIT